MDIETAFKSLGLPSSASAQEIKQSFRRLTKRAHPDSKSGSKSRQTKLNKAKEIALAYSSIKNSVVAISPNEITDRIEQAIARTKLGTTREEAHAQLRRRTFTLNGLKWFSWVIGGVAGLISLTSGNLDGLISVSDAQLRLIKIDLKLMAFAFGIFGFVIQFIIKSTERQIDRFLDSISDKASCASALAEYLNYDDASPVPESKLKEETIERVSPISYLRDLFDKRDLVVRKAIELNVLQIDEPEEITPDHNVKYKLNFRPSLFEPEPPPPPKPRTRSDIVSDFKFGLAGTGFFAVIALGLYFWGAGLWSLAPTVLALLMLSLAVLSMLEWRKFT